MGLTDEQRAEQDATDWLKGRMRRVPLSPERKESVMTAERLNGIRAKVIGPDVLELIAEIDRLRKRETALIAACNLELESKRQAQAQAIAYEVTARALMAEAARPYDLQRRVVEWVATRIGPEHMASAERALRTLEEAVELAQAEGITAEQVIRQVEHVYARPAGNPVQEMGGVLVCAMAWCASRDQQLLDVAQREVERIEAKPIESIRGSLARKQDADLVTVINPEDGR